MKPISTAHAQRSSHFGLRLLVSSVACSGLLAIESLQAGPPPLRDAPSFLSAAGGDASVRLAWQPSAGALSYNVKRGLSMTGAFEIIATGLTAPAYEDTTAANQRRYFYVVSAVHESGETGNSFPADARPSLAVLDVLPAGAAVEKLVTGMQFTEGPVWIPSDGGFLVWSDLNGNRLYQWAPGKPRTVFRQGSNRANGNTLDLQGRLISCEQTTRRVSITQPDGTIQSLVDRYDGKRFNAPNDVVVKSDGTVWFTDPTYGIPGRKELSGQFVFRFDPASGETRLVAEGFDQPNGLAFSPDESKLYVADSGGPAQIRVFDVQADGSLAGDKVFTKVSSGSADGMRVHSDGRVFATTGDGVRIYSPDGALLGRLVVAEIPANIEFGGTSDEMILITARTALYGITRMPDLVVSPTLQSSTLPVAGKQARFTAIVRNQGTGPTPPGASIRVGFRIDDNETAVVWSESYTTPLPPGGAVALTSEAGGASGAWTASPGTHTVRAVADDLAGIPESREDNNSSTAIISVITPVDTDGDGMSDDDEALAGTDPADPNSLLKFAAAVSSGPGSVTVTWSSVPGKVYRVTSKGALAGQAWSSPSADITATAAETSYTDPSAPQNSERFYRVELVQ